MDVTRFLKAVLSQEENTIRTFFHKDAIINWHCTNERFTVDEYIIANCQYPGDWDGIIERVEVLDNLYIIAARVYSKDRSVFFHVVSFLKTEHEKIISMDEYWADNGSAPQWRLDKHIGMPIR